ncbi:1-(5-phosphoribosyl)-5-[(5-phosphoribosylamino)methylideneamino]imidazole-4-carboxamide isomerase [Gloeobacter morelensis]|uniref:1-(5-phosphoribosyl)-5-[(5-phosphoribosylamino)methylideneamino] imidazole-4-carboxamide isomerase n=1 Tax=Gloeobacter morelensis MG652769 TaxID=2781736 RepID=A0ABY3PHH7_9CYAN|nr:1-(5-phosphoribosyl)-5-[(5-phosphoribosylamino)methylideneamino]imidazole-4-carboxamide isomerase [Gloeobacter morelensis]UFP93120.1 1-(5-phosphoribosyl)-5-[(5-phosphoribosylamino)methylideneamino]imidazole-4-carboxamide isomerase [Gloeobacter morelensis MG652769]
MDIIPAIDILDGRCVRLYQGNYQLAETYGEDPVAVACNWAKLGAPRLHVVDLDGARQGMPVHLDALEAIVTQVPCPVQFGGGLRSIEAVSAVLDRGVDRVILGTAAVENPALIRECCERFGGRIAVGLDARGGQVAVRGWRETSEVEVTELAGEMEKLGVSAIVYTDILKDGTLTGPNLVELQRLTDAVKVPIIASGGVGTLADVLYLLALEPRGLQGVIIGRALYTGDVDLAEALRAAGPSRWQDVPPDDVAFA